MVHHQLFIDIWNRQIELFAKYFIIHARLPKNPTFTLLDVGCGTGTALRIIKTKYPNAQLSGCDIEPEHIEISNQSNGVYGNFFISDIESLTAHWDIIYLSNVLEHLYEWKEQLGHLLKRTERLYLLVPYNEKNLSSSPDKSDHSFHVNSFNKESFKYLTGLGFKIHQRIITTPWAWGASPLRNIMYKLKISSNKQDFKSELLVCITCPNASKSKPFNTRFSSFFKKYFLIILPIYLKKYFRK